MGRDHYVGLGIVAFICLTLCFIVIANVYDIEFNIPIKNDTNLATDKLNEVLIYFNETLQDSIVNAVLKDGKVSEIELENLKELKGYNQSIQVFVIKNDLLNNSDWDGDGISNHNEKIIGTNPTVRDEFYVVDDLFSLPEISDGIDSKKLAIIKKVMKLERSNDPEVLKGLKLIDSFCKKHNYAQLELLLWLAENGKLDDNDYNRVALALALDYGVVLDYSNSEVDKKVKEYIIELYNHIKEVDGFLKEKGLEWRAKDYPLEANMLLVWGACGARYPTFYTDKSEVKTPWTVYWYNTFDKRKMNLDDFNWLFVSVDTLNEERKWIETFISDNISIIADNIDEYVSTHFEYHTDKPCVDTRFVNVNGKLMKCRISNPDWQWNELKLGAIKGNCEDICFMDVMLLKSLNIPAGCVKVLSRNFGHSVIVYFDYRDGRLRTTDYQQELIDKHCKNGVAYLLHKIPWDDAYNKRQHIYLIRSVDKAYLKKGFSVSVITSS